MELHARNKLIPGPEYIVTVIKVCRHFAYVGTINQILSFIEEFELYQRLHGLLIPFRVGRLPASDHYDPNDPNFLAEDMNRTYLQRLNHIQRRLSIINQRVQPRYTQTHPFVRVAENFQQSFADDGIYSFSMFLVNNSGPCQPFTVKKWRALFLNHGILDRMQVHEQWPDLCTKQFNYQELSATLYFLTS
jgi:hypothetical protein